MVAEYMPTKFESLFCEDIAHVGGVNDFLGGVDPFADEKLMRLFSFGC